VRNILKGRVPIAVDPARHRCRYRPGAGRVSLAFLLWLLLIPVVRLIVRLVVLERRWPGIRRPTSR
jgi:hypothetical protein